MTAVLERPAAAASTPRASRNGWIRRHRRSILTVAPLLAVTAAVRLIGMVTAPQRIDDEGTYVAQAYAVQHYGSLGHYTYWYDHPPLGWIQLAGWTWATNAFERAPNAVAAGREFMVVLAVVAAALLFVLGRRLGVSRVGSVAAVLIMALSPLAVQFQRTVYLDNVATPWALGAFVLALSPRRRLAATAGAAAAFAVAVLSKETYLLLLPGLLWLMLRHSAPSTRRYALTVAASLFVLLGGGYVLLAVIKGELLPGTGRVSLLDGLAFQLEGRASSGSILDTSSATFRTVDVWWNLDPVLPVATALAVAGGLAVRRLRPVAVLVGFLALMMLRPGYLPVPYVIALLPFAALLVAGVVDAAVRAAKRGGVTRLAGGITAVVLAIGATSVATPAWGSELRGLVRADLDAPLAQARSWVAANVAQRDPLLVDDAIWVDLVRAGRARADVVWFYKADTDPAVIAQAPDGWRDYAWVVSTQAVRRSLDGAPTVAQAVANSTLAAGFGSGDTRVEIRRVHPEGIENYRAQQRTATAARVEAGSQLAANPALRADPEIRDLLSGGRVDARAMAALSALAAQRPVRLVAVPAIEGEETDGQTGPLPRRQLVVARDGGGPGSDPAAFFRAQTGTYAPSTVREQGDQVVVTYPNEP